MSAVQDGQLIEGVLYLLDNNPIINPTFNSPAISITHLAGSLGFNPSLINPRQICQAIAPLAETLFPTPRIPVFRTHLNEGWIVFEESTSTNVKPLKLAKRTTLTSYSNSGKGLNVNIPPETEGALPSAPLRQTSSGELVKNLPVRRDPPSSARIEPNKGKKSFLRPFLLGGRKKKGEMPAAAMHQSKREEESDVHSIKQIVDEHLQVELDTPESRRETIASTPQHNSDGDEHGSGEASPVWAPLGKGKKGVSKRVAEMRVDEGVPSSPGVVTPTTAKVPLTPVTPISPVSPSIVDSPILSPISTPTTAVNQVTPVETDIPLTPEPTTPIIPSPVNTTPPSPSTPSTPIPTTPTTTNKPSAQRERGHERGRDHHHRNPDETSDERRNRKEREHARRKEGFEGEQRARSSRSEIVEKEDTWLEVIFEDLPFGPDKDMSRAVESIKRDYKIFLAEIIALGGLAYVIQRSGW